MPESWKLTEAQKREIVRQYKAGRRSDQIATEFGITRYYVTELARYRGHYRRKQRSKKTLKGSHTESPTCAASTDS